MVHDIKLIVYPVKDLEKAKLFYGELLEVEPYADSPYYVGYKVGDLEVGLDPNSTVGPIAYNDTDDIQAMLEAMVAVGAKIIQEPKDVGDGLLIAQVQDADGNVIGFRQASK